MDGDGKRLSVSVIYAAHDYSVRPLVVGLVASDVFMCIVEHVSLGINSI